MIEQCSFGTLQLSHKLFGSESILGPKKRFYGFIVGQTRVPGENPLLRKEKK